MIELEDATSCIATGVHYNRNRIKQELVSFYDEEQCCYGDKDITNLEIYEVKNPFFLADTFVFCQKHYDNVFLKGECDFILYIKVNNSNEIEEIGNDFSRRFHFDDYEELLKRKDVHKAEPIHKLLFCLIGDEYWLKSK